MSRQRTFLKPFMKGLCRNKNPRPDTKCREAGRLCKLIRFRQADSHLHGKLLNAHSRFFHKVSLLPFCILQTATALLECDGRFVFRPHLKDCVVRGQILVAEAVMLVDHFFHVLQLPIRPLFLSVFHAISSFNLSMGKLPLSSRETISSIDVRWFENNFVRCSCFLLYCTI